MKKIISVLLCAVMLFVSCATKGDEPLTPPEPSDTEAPHVSSEESSSETDPPETEPEAPPVEPREREFITSPEPMRYYSGKQGSMRIPNGEFVSYGYDGITVTAEILEALEDTYISFTDWGKNEKRLLRMKTVNNLGEGDVAGEFYWMLPVDCFTDFTEYKYIVFRSAYQISIENSVWYNITLGCAERFDLPIYTSFEREEPDCEWVMAFGADGLLDNSLWYINDKLTEDTNYFLEYLKSKDYDKYVKFTEETYTLKDAESDFKEKIYSVVNTHTLESRYGNAAEAIAYTMDSQNGIFIGKEHSDTITRYINGYPTNEWVSGYWNHSKCSDVKFTDEDVENAPDLASALKEIGEDFAAGKIRPMHIQTYAPDDYFNHALCGSYYKTEDGVYAVISLTWKYSFYKLKRDGYLDEYALKNLDDDLIDHRYYIIRPGSNMYEEITSDEYHDLMNSEERAEYDKYGLIYFVREVYKPNKN